MINLPEPFLGRLVIEILQESVEDYKKALYGFDTKTEDKESSEFRSKFEIVSAITEVDENGNVRHVASKDKVPFKKGKILKMAPDAFGERFKKNYGTDGSLPAIGDTIMFVPNQTYKIDPAGKYHIIGDENIIAFYKGAN